MYKALFYRWSDFSSSETKPLFWMLIGPLLMMLTLIVAIPILSNSLLPLISVVGLIASWRYRVSGFALTLMAFVLYFSLNYLLGHRLGFSEAWVWQVGFGCSLAIGLTISFLSMEELKSFYSNQTGKKDKIISDLKLSIYSLDEKSSRERRTFDREVEGLKEQQKSLQDEVEALLSLVEGSRIESEKVFRHSDALSSESLAQHREIETLKQELKSTEETMEELSSRHESLSLSAQERLQALNTKRVELYQSRLLIEGYEKQLQRAREYFLAQKKPQPTTAPLQTLEQEKGMIKKVYDQIQEEFLALKRVLEEERVKLEKMPDESLHSEVKKLSGQVALKKKELEQVKGELIDIERDIFFHKKGLQEKGSFAH